MSASDGDVERAPLLVDSKFAAQNGSTTDLIAADEAEAAQIIAKGGVMGFLFSLGRKMKYDSEANDAVDKQQQQKQQGLAKVLSVWQLTFLGVGMIIGAGIFTIVGKAVREAGPGIIVSMLLVGVTALLIALCYSELSSNIPVAGSAFSFVYVTFGELAAWFVGWNLILEYTVAAAVIARAWANYLFAFLTSIGVRVPTFLTPSSAGSSIVSFNVIAAIILLLLTLLVAYGVSESASVNTVVVIIKVGILIFFSAYGFANVKSVNYSEFFPHGSNGVFKGAAVIFFAFLGFDGVSAMAEEAQDAKRAMPRAIMGSLAICSVLYCCTGAALVGLVNYAKVSTEDPLSDAFRDSKPLSGLVALSAVCGITTAIIGAILGQSRVYLSMARAGLIPRAFAAVSSTRSTPILATALSGIPAAAMGMALRIDIIANLTSLGACAAFILVCASVLHRRYARKAGHWTLMRRIFSLLACSITLSLGLYGNWPRPVLLGVAGALLLSIVPFALLDGDAPDDTSTFHTPFVPAVPVVAIVLIVHIAIGQGGVAFAVYSVWVALGLVVYFSFGFWNSVLAPDNVKKQ